MKYPNFASKHFHKLYKHNMWMDFTLVPIFFFRQGLVFYSDHRGATNFAEWNQFFLHFWKCFFAGRSLKVHPEGFHFFVDSTFCNKISICKMSPLPSQKKKHQMVSFSFVLEILGFKSTGIGPLIWRNFFSKVVVPYLKYQFFSV